MYHRLKIILLFYPFSFAHIRFFFLTLGATPSEQTNGKIFSFSFLARSRPVQQKALGTIRLERKGLVQRNPSQFHPHPQHSSPITSSMLS